MANIVCAWLAIEWRLSLGERLASFLIPPAAFVVLVMVATAIPGHERILSARQQAIRERQHAHHSSPPNQTITQWGHVFGDEMIASAVLDRVLHHSHVLVIQGDSFRLRQKKRAGLLSSTKANH